MTVRVLMLSHAVIEESGGPGMAAAGFAVHLAQQGTPTILLALDSPPGRWLLDDATTLPAGLKVLRVPNGNMLTNAVRLMRVASGIAGGCKNKPLVWVNGIWGPQSLAAFSLARRFGWPFVVRPAGSLGCAALRYRRLKKQVYYRMVERHIAVQAAGIHCMSDREVSELPAELQARAFVVPLGVDLPAMAAANTSPHTIVGVLARLHPIKRQHAVLDAIEELVAGGCNLQVEFAGAISDAYYARQLKDRVAQSSVLANCVTFLGHVPRSSLAEVVGRWRAALLLSEQENFGHAVVNAAALGVPTVVSPGVGIGVDLTAAGAGAIAQPDAISSALQHFLHADREATASRCREFARRFAWPSVASDLRREFERRVA